MSELEALNAKLQHTLECSVCLERFNGSTKIPRRLPCNHTFCEGCITDVLSPPSPMRTALCPLCRAPAFTSTDAKAFNVDTTARDTADAISTISAAAAAAGVAEQKHSGVKRPRPNDGSDAEREVKRIKPSTPASASATKTNAQMLEGIDIALSDEQFLIMFKLLEKAPLILEWLSVKELKYVLEWFPKKETQFIAALTPSPLKSLAGKFKGFLAELMVSVDYVQSLIGS